jgi:hypothetical protein
MVLKEKVYTELAQGKMAGFFGLSKYVMILPVTSSVTRPMHIFIIYKGIEIKEHRLRVFENRVLRRIFGPKRDEVTGLEKTAY